MMSNSIQGWTMTSNYFHGWKQQSLPYAGHQDVADDTHPKRQQRQYRRLHQPTTLVPKREQQQNLQRHQPATRAQQKHAKLSLTRQLKNVPTKHAKPTSNAWQLQNKNHNRAYADSRVA